MDLEDRAKRSSGGSPEELLHDRGLPGLLCNHLPSIQSSSHGDHSPSYPDPVSSHLTGMNTAAPDLLPGSMRERKDEKYQTAPRRQSGPLNLLNLPTDVLKEMLSQVRHDISLPHLSHCC